MKDNRIRWKVVRKVKEDRNEPYYNCNGFPIEGTEDPAGKPVVTWKVKPFMNYASKVS